MEGTNDERIVRLETTIDQHQKAIDEFGRDVKEIKEKLLLRPSWAVTVILSLLLAICSAETVFVLTNSKSSSSETAMASIIK